jgi:hypothetical protein
VFTEDGLPAVQPVNFRLWRDDIVIRAAGGAKLAAAKENLVVAFEADELDTEHFARLVAQHLNLRAFGKSLRANHIKMVSPDPLPAQKVWNMASHPASHYRTQPERLRDDANNRGIEISQTAWKALSATRRSLIVTHDPRSTTRGRPALVRRVTHRNASRQNGYATC